MVEKKGDIGNLKKLVTIATMHNIICKAIVTM
jgi:hypothetical protein